MPLGNLDVVFAQEGGEGVFVQQLRAELLGLGELAGRSVCPFAQTFVARHWRAVRVA
jgi:hypothetical protein